MKTMDVIAAVLVVVGALNWGMVGMFQFDLVAALFGNASGMSRLVYSLVGFAGIFQAMQWKGIQRRWSMIPAMSRA